MEYSGNEFDAIVIGAGIMGSTTAYELAKRGKKTLLLEQFDFLHHRGSSHGESRTIRATYPEDYYCAMAIESFPLWEEAQSEIGFKVYFKAQHLDMGPSDNKSLLSVISSCKKNSVSFQVLDSQQVPEKFSGRINIPENWIGVSAELGGVLRPTKAVSMFQSLASRKGAVLRDNTEVNNIIKDDVRGGLWVFAANGEKFWAEKCVITAGAWVRKLVKTVSGLDLPIQALETTVCYWRIKEGHESEFTMGVDFPTFASYGQPYVYGTPSLEFPGLIKIAVHGGRACNPDKRPWGPCLTLSSLKEWIERTFSGLVDSDGPVATQSCMYSMTPDEDYVIDFLGEEFGKDVVVGGGFSGHGFKMAPVIGRILADLALDGEAKGVDLNHFSIQRFRDNPQGNMKDYEDQVDFFSNHK
ncbi:probable sarcosine oxidase [Ricinus communis]|uniref:Sarcosine oxidase, putative n=1 Tax=Ricinus communis TaxID=3988 RepID=B9TA32_RICCO|nr:probable sarcosine oxidase [Ricinus communis]EEF27281.1 sarcosine oxidase, putative [Ricinus communis]|eukprot:XP_002535101.1 probable sarcosine oxidase [Ricinus communis]